MAKPERRLTLASDNTRKLDRRTAIINAATEVWNAQGARGFSMASVARLVGVHPVSLSHYFKTKNELASVFMLDTISRITAMAKEASRQPTPRERVLAYIHASLELRRQVVEGRAAPLAHFGEIRRIDPTPNSPVIEAFRGFLREMRNLFEAPGGPDRPKALLFARLVIENTGWAYSWISLYEPSDYAAVADRLADIMLDGIAARGQTWPELNLPVLGEAATAGVSRDRFLITATELINNHGFNGASIDAIAASLNVTKGSFYHHMSDKEDLLLACFDRAFDLKREALVKAADQPDGWRRLCMSAGALVMHATRSDSGPLLRSQTLAALSPKTRPIMAQRYGDVALRLAVVISSGIADGSIRPIDPFIAAETVLATVNASLDLHHWMRDAENVDLMGTFLRPALMGLQLD